MGAGVTPFQRVYAEDTAMVLALLAEEQANLAAAETVGDDTARLALLGRVGERERILGRLDDATLHLQAALALAQEHGDRKREITNLIRLATALHYAEGHTEADALFRECLATIERTGEREREDFAHQHYGKCLAEMGQRDEAAAHFAHALALRRAKGDAGLIASTEAAIAALDVRTNRLLP